MVVARLAYLNTKRVLRNKALRLVIVALPLLVALLRIVLVGNKSILLAAHLLPAACALLLAAALYTQWSIDSTRGLIAGLNSSAVSGRSVVVSRILSGAMILLAQMALFVGVLAIRF